MLAVREKGDWKGPKPRRNEAHTIVIPCLPSQRLQGDARASPSHRSVSTGGHGRSGGIRLDEEEDEEEDEDATLAFEMEQQQQLLSRQDNTLDLIGNTLTGLRRQASHLGQEIGEQVELIGALDTEVDSSQSKLTRALGKMDELVRRSDDRMGGWCVWLLILVRVLCQERQGKGDKEFFSWQTSRLTSRSPLSHT